MKLILEAWRQICGNTECCKMGGQGFDFGCAKRNKFLLQNALFRFPFVEFIFTCVKFTAIFIQVYKKNTALGHPH